MSFSTNAKLTFGKMNGSYRLETAIDFALFVGADIDFGIIVNFNLIVKPTKFTSKKNKVIES